MSDFPFFQILELNDGRLVKYEGFDTTVTPVKVRIRPLLLRESSLALGNVESIERKDIKKELSN